jgi:murein DD-endopeptidase MepM/ murein hydrolase activator NlpD
MPTTLQKLKRVTFVIYLIALHGVVLYFVGERVLHRFTSITPVETAAVNDPNEAKSIPTPLPVPEAFADPVDANVNANSNSNSNSETVPSGPASKGLIIPVAGIRPDQLIDTYAASRSEGRSHDAIDIMAPGGTPVIAATDGEIIKFWDSDRGGITIYQMTDDRRFILYYAHLQRRADEISVGMHVRKGTTIGFVGDTGNAGPGNYHLHFSIALVTDPKRFWSGIYLNPYPILKNGEYPQ